MGNQEVVLTSPTTTQYFLSKEPQARQYFLDETARARAAWSPPDTFPRKYLPIIFEPFGDSNSSSLSDLSNCSYQRSFPELGRDSDFESPSIPPSPSNLETLSKTWEQVKAKNSNLSKPADTLSPKLKALGRAQEKRKIHRDWVKSKFVKSYPPTISEEEALRLRGGRIEWELNRFAGKYWASLYETASRRLSEDRGIQDHLKSINLWLSPETKGQGSEIEIMIKNLEESAPDNEAEWKDFLWTNFFFRLDRVNETFHLHVARQQLHTFNEKDSNLQNRCPPITENTEARSFVPASKTPYDADPNRQKSGFAFNDYSYAVRMKKEFSKKTSS